MSVPNELDGKIYNPDDPQQQECLHKAKCYVDRTVNPPLIRVIKDDEDYEIIGWVRLTDSGVLTSNGVNVTSDGLYFIYNNRKYPPGLYWLIRKDGRKSLVRDEFLGVNNG